MLRTPSDDLADAIEHFEVLDFEGALAILARVVAFAPDNALAYELWVWCHVELGRPERAIQLADEGLARGLAPAALHVQKAGALRMLDRFDEAASAADAAMALDPRSLDAVRTRAAVEIDRGDFDAALQLLRQAAQRNPDDPESHFALLKLADELERHDLVIESAREYLRTFEKDPDVLAMLGNAYLVKRDYRRADRAFRDAAHLDPDEVSHHINVLLIALQTGNDAGFETYLERLAQRDPGLADRAAHEVDVLLARAREEPDSTDG